MGKEIVEIKQPKPVLEPRMRVAAYARVSCGKDAMLHSLAAQIDYYRNLINSIRSGELKAVVYQLYQNDVSQGTINIGDNNYCSFTPEN